MTNITVIAELAKQKDKQDEFDTAELVGLGDAMATAIIEATKEEKDRAVKAAALEVVALRKTTNAKKLDIINEIRANRRKQAELLAKIKAIDLAQEYGNQTMNYLPLAVQIGVVSRIPHDVVHLTKVPEGFGGKKPVAKKAK